MVNSHDLLFGGHNPWRIQAPRAAARKVYAFHIRPTSRVVTIMIKLGNKISEKLWGSSTFTDVSIEA